MKKLIALFLLISLIFVPMMVQAECILEGGSMVHVYIEQMGRWSSPTIVFSDQVVIVMPEQPTAEQLQMFGDHPTVATDWSDGTIVYDEDDRVTVLVHRKDLSGDCELKN